MDDYNGGHSGCIEQGLLLAAIVIILFFAAYGFSSLAVEHIHIEWIP